MLAALRELMSTYFCSVMVISCYVFSCSRECFSAMYPRPDNKQSCCRTGEECYRGLRRGSPLMCGVMGFASSSQCCNSLAILFDFNHLISNVYYIW